MPYRHLVLFVAAVATLHGCTSVTGSDSGELEQRLIDAKILWSAQTLQNYEYVGSLRCFCAFGGAEARVSVTSNAVTAVEFGAQVITTATDLTAFLTVDQLFAKLEDAVRNHAYRITATFDAQLGYPREFFIDYSENAADEELGYQINVLSPSR